MQNNSSGTVNTAVLKSLAAVLFIALFTFLGMHQLQPPKVVPSSAPPTEFSADRAMKHIEAIAQAPHWIGSPEHDRVRDYILSEFTAAGLNPGVQATASISQTIFPIPTSYVLAADVEHILVRLKGADNTRAILIAGHYDSVVTSPNASDGGAAVAIALEVARILRAGPPLKNDVIFLLTDCEEYFSLGARTFVEKHPWAQDIGLVLHFIARGTSGPSIMFETSPENGWLIEQFAQFSSHPIGNSLAYEVYQILPNDTDFTHYKGAGWSGLNFGYIDDPVHYHTMLDNPENLDRRSLQHQGLQALALTRHFGNLDLTNIKKDDVIFFDLWGLTVIYYPEKWVIPLTFAVTLVYVIVVALGLRKKQLTFSGLGRGILAFLATILGVFVMITLLERAILALHSQYRFMFQGKLYNSQLYLISFVSLTIAMTSTLYTLFCKKISLLNLIAGGLLVWLILTLVTCFLLPGASYLFMWPLLFNLLALGIVFGLKSPGPMTWRQFVVFSVCAIPGLVLFVPTAYLVYIALSPLTTGGLAVALLAVLLLEALIPHLTLLAKPKAWLLPVTMAAIGAGFLITGSLTSDFNLERPRLNSIHYGFNADTGEAVWMCRDRQLDEWTSQFFPDGATLDLATDYIIFNNVLQTPIFVGPAPVVSTPIANVTLLEDNISDGVRKMRLSFTLPQPARMLFVHVNMEPNTILRARVAGMDADMRINPEYPWVVSILKYGYLPSRKGVELELETTSTQPVKFVTLGAYDGLPQTPVLSFEPRSAHMIPAPDIAGVFRDLTVVRKSFEFPVP